MFFILLVNLLRFLCGYTKQIVCVSSECEAAENSEKKQKKKSAFKIWWYSLYRFMLFYDKSFIGTWIIFWSRLIHCWLFGVTLRYSSFNQIFIQLNKKSIWNTIDLQQFFIILFKFERIFVVAVAVVWIEHEF